MALSDTLPFAHFSVRQVLDALADATIAAGKDGKIVYANPAAERLLGWQNGALAGELLAVLMPARMHSAHGAGFERYMRTHEPHIMGKPVRVPARRRDGSELDVELTLSALEAPDGTTLIVASLRDLRDRVELEQQLATTLNDLRRARCRSPAFSYFAHAAARGDLHSAAR